MEAIALADFTDAKNEELAFKKGTILKVKLVNRHIFLIYAVGQKYGDIVHVRITY